MEKQNVFKWKHYQPEHYFVNSKMVPAVQLELS